LFRHLGDEFVIKLRQDCERYFWLAGDNQNYPNVVDLGVFDGTINKRSFTNGGLIVLGPPSTFDDFPFNFDHTFDLANIYDNELWTLEQYNTLPNPLTSDVVSLEHKFFGGEIGDNEVISRFDVLGTTRFSHIQISTLLLMLEIFPSVAYRLQKNSVISALTPRTQPLIFCYCNVLSDSVNKNGSNLSDHEYLLICCRVDTFPVRV